MVERELHPSEEHALVAETVVRRVLDRRGRVQGVLPLIVPGSLEEREVLAAIDDMRLRSSERPPEPEERRRRLRRHWRDARP